MTETNRLIYSMTETARRERLYRLGILEEPLGYVDGANLYRYVKNNPLDNTDPTGLRGQDKEDAIRLGQKRFQGSIRPKR